MIRSLPVGSRLEQSNKLILLCSFKNIYFIFIEAVPQFIENGNDYVHAQSQFQQLLMPSLLLASTHSAETVRHSYTELTADAKITIRARTYAEQTAA